MRPLQHSSSEQADINILGVLPDMNLREKIAEVKAAIDFHSPSHCVQMPFSYLIYEQKLKELRELERQRDSGGMV